MNAAAVSGLLYTMFDKVKIRVNGVFSSDGYNYYGYIGPYNTLPKYNRRSERCCLEIYYG